MVKLTADLIYGAAQYTNAIRERELDLSGKFYCSHSCILLRMTLAGFFYFKMRINLHTP